MERGPSEKGYTYAVDFWALGIMFLQMLCGEQLDFPQMFASYSEENNEGKNLAEILELPRHIKSEARTCVVALLENDPEKRLGSPNSPHGPIRDHPFFKVGRQIDWQSIDDGLFKSTFKHSVVNPHTYSSSLHRFVVVVCFRLLIFRRICPFVRLSQH